MAILDGPVKNMNDSWVRCSKIVAKDLREDKRIRNHEDWLDCLNLHETSWMLFACTDYDFTYKFGWPDKKHE